MCTEASHLEEERKYHKDFYGMLESDQKSYYILLNAIITQLHVYAFF